METNQSIMMHDAAAALFRIIGLHTILLKPSKLRGKAMLESVALEPCWSNPELFVKLPRRGVLVSSAPEFIADSESCRPVRRIKGEAIVFYDACIYSIGFALALATAVRNLRRPCWWSSTARTSPKPEVFRM
jgi:hypothetical protein